MTTTTETVDSKSSPEIIEVFKKGYQSTMDNKQFAFGFFLILIVVNFAGSFVSGALNSFAIAFLLEIIFSLLMVYLTYGATKGILNIIDGKKVDLEILTKTTSSSFIGLLIVSILSSLIIFVGFIALILPGIYLALRFFFVQTIYIDKGYETMKNFSESAKLTKGRKLNLILFSIALVIFNTLGFLAFIIGLIFTVPVSMFAVVHYYRALQPA